MWYEMRMDAAMLGECRVMRLETGRGLERMHSSAIALLWSRSFFRGLRILAVITYCDSERYGVECLARSEHGRCGGRQDDGWTGVEMEGRDGVSDEQ